MNGTGTNNSRSPRQKERGIIIILVAAGLLAFFGLVILVVGVGFLATNRNRFQAAVNLAGLAAMEEFVNRQGGTHYAVNANLARNKANSILAQNKLAGVQGLLGDLQLSDESSPPPHPGGVIEFGVWNRSYTGYPTSDCVVSGGETCPCGLLARNYPCFRPNDNPMPPDNTFANAVRITASNQSDNPILIPIARIIGPDHFQITAQATVTLVQRCTEFLVDVSSSVAQESHSLVGIGRDLTLLPPGSPPPNPNITITQPSPNGYDWGLMVMKRSETDIADSNIHFCENLNTATADQVVWCNLKRPLFQNRGGDTEYHKHFKSDYKSVESPIGQLWVQNYVDLAQGSYVGEPFSRFFLAINAALRLLSTQGSGNDLSAMTVFRGTVNPNLDRWPPPPQQLTNDNGILMQLTDVLNVGTPASTTRHPNFADRLWLPLASSDTTISGNNLSLALLTAINDLSSCPAAARKSILLATDGVPTCSYPIDFASHTYGPSNCTHAWSTYLAAQDEILLKILPELVKRRIAVSVMWEGQHIDTNFINRCGPVPCSAGGHLLDFPEALAQGFDAYDPSDPDPTHPLFNYNNYPGSSPCPTNHPDCGVQGTECFGNCTDNADRFAYLHNGVPFTVGGVLTDTYFRRANGILAKLALDTGGVACPLLPPCGSADCLKPGPGVANCYENDPNDPTTQKLKDVYRVENQQQRCAVKNRSMTEQAAFCALKAVGDSPFLLAESGS